VSSNRASKAWDMISVLGRGGPGLCNIAVTNACNAACDFCNFARGKIRRADLCWIDSARFEAALNILYSRDIRYVSFFGGEPLLHPELANMIRMAVARGMVLASSQMAGSFHRNWTSLLRPESRPLTYRLTRRRWPIMKKTEGSRVWATGFETQILA
jgi:organic radical activating enzyme